MFIMNDLCGTNTETTNQKLQHIIKYFYEDMLRTLFIELNYTQMNNKNWLHEV